MKNQRSKAANRTARTRIESPDFAAISREIFGDRTFKGDAVEMERAGYDTRQLAAAQAEGLEVKP